MRVDVKELTMEQIWGAGNDIMREMESIRATKKSKKATPLYSLQLNDGHFAIFDFENDEVGGVRHLEHADQFTRDEVEDVRRRFWISAKVVIAAGGLQPCTHS